VNPLASTGSRGRRFFRKGTLIASASLPSGRRRSRVDAQMEVYRRARTGSIGSAAESVDACLV
jgi:hypothetical protein